MRFCALNCINLCKIRFYDCNTKNVYPRVFLRAVSRKLCANLR
jgi:hypothetical protein